MTAHILGLPAIAVSLDVGGSGIAHWETAAWGVRQMVSSWPSESRCGVPLHNLNVPNLPVGELAGIQITGLSTNVCLTNYRIALCAENLRIISGWMLLPLPLARHKWRWARGSADGACSSAGRSACHRPARCTMGLG